MKRSPSAWIHSTSIRRSSLLKLSLLALLSSLVGLRVVRAEGSVGAPTDLVVSAKLVEIPTKFPPDDLYDYAYVMRYQVIGGAMDGQSILVAHYKPRQPRAKIADAMKAHVGGKLRSFKTGDTHKLQLSSNLKSIWKGALVDEFAATDRKSIRYWALSVDPA